MSTAEKHVVFDIVGTVVNYDKIFEAIDTRLGSRLRAECIQPRFLGYAWLETAEREYTYLSMSGKYMTFYTCFKSLFFRLLWQAGIQDPHTFATNDDLEYILQQYLLLEARPGAKECIESLRAAGFTVWALTAGDARRVRGYFSNNDISMPLENFMTCDTLGVGKPSPEAYLPLLERFGKAEAWFAAAHMWDVSAAKRAGFKGAYCSVWEKEPCEELFGRMDVMSDTLIDMADRIITASASASSA